MHKHAPELSKPQVKIPGKDFQTKDKTFVLPSPFRLGLDPEEIRRIALRSGFMKRRPRKIEPGNFLQALVFMSVMPVFSMRALAIHLGILTHNVISKVAVFLRMKPTVIDFVREALFNSVSATSRLKEEIGKGAFNSFRRVLLQDSTNLALPPKLATHFPGAKNQSGKTGASVKLQTTYNSLTETFVSFGITPYRCNDQCASPSILDIIGDGDLVIRDLGYSSLRVFRAIGEKKAFYLSRYSHKIALFHPSSKRFDLLGSLKKHGTLDETLLAGSEERLPVRVVAIPVPEPVASQRRRKLLHNKDRRLNPDPTHLALLGWEIFLTNVPQKIWDAKTVCRIYGVRWRIEIIFKSWKSHFKIHAFAHPTPTEVELLIYARLIYITLFQCCFFTQLAAFVYDTTGQHLSVLKAADFFSQRVLPALFTGADYPLILQQILKHCTYEKRNKRVNYGQVTRFLAENS
jgi:Transposase DDE domain